MRGLVGLSQVNCNCWHTHAWVSNSLCNSLNFAQPGLSSTSEVMEAQRCGSTVDNSQPLAVLKTRGQLSIALMLVQAPSWTGWQWCSNSLLPCHAAHFVLHRGRLLPLQTSPCGGKFCDTTLTTTTLWSWHSLCLRPDSVLQRLQDWAE